MNKLIIVLLATISSLMSCKGQKKSTSITRINTEVIQKIITSPDTQLIDVRTPLEYKRGYIGHAINANMFTSSFTSVISKLDKSKPVYLYCHKGGRSSTAAKKLVENGFTRVYDYTGGWKAWQKHLNNSK